MITKEPVPWMGGYVEFTPLRVELERQARLKNNTRRNDSRDSTLDDVISHLQTYIQESEGLPSADNLCVACATLVDNLATANWMVLLELVKMRIGNLDWRIDENTSDYNGEQSAQAEYCSRNEVVLHKFRRYWTEYRQQVFNNIVQLDVSLNPVSYSPLQTQLLRRSTGLHTDTSAESEINHRKMRATTDQRDWSYILCTLETSISQVADLSNHMAIRLANVEAYRSNQFANAAQRLSALGIIFLPLSLLVGIFSMDDKFLPGSKLFWVVVIIAIPLAFGCALAFLPVRKWTNELPSVWSKSITNIRNRGVDNKKISV
jgi:hypothetical protein